MDLSGLEYLKQEVLPFVSINYSAKRQGHKIYPVKYDIHVRCADASNTSISKIQLSETLMQIDNSIVRGNAYIKITVKRS